MELKQIKHLVLWCVVCLVLVLSIACGRVPETTSEPPLSETPNTLTEPVAKMFLNLAEQTRNLPFDVLTLWSANRFLSERGFLATFIQPALERNFEDFGTRPNFDNQDALMVELLFQNPSTATADLLFDLSGNNSQIQLLTNLTMKFFDQISIAPQSWIEVVSPVTVAGDLGWLEADDAENAPSVVYHTAAGDTLTLAPGQTARVWLPFIINNGYDTVVVSLSIQTQTGTETILSLN